MKSNGWSEGTAALQLFAHLDGEALNVALLMPKGEREKWEGKSSQVKSNLFSNNIISTAITTNNRVLTYDN